MPGGTSTASGLALARDALPDAPMFDGSPSLESIEVATATSSAAVPNWFGSLAAWARPPAAVPSDAELRFASIGDAAQLGYSLKSTSPSAPRPAVAPVSSERPRTTPARAAAPATERIRRAVRQVSAKPDAGEASKRAVLERTVENMLRDRLLSN
jgi:hypothetical protein